MNYNKVLNDLYEAGLPREEGEMYHYKEQGGDKTIKKTIISNGIVFIFDTLGDLIKIDGVYNE